MLGNPWVAERHMASREGPGCMELFICIHLWCWVGNFADEKYSLVTLNYKVTICITTWCWRTLKDIVTCIPIARQRVGKHFPTTHATIGRLLLGNGAVNTLELWSVFSAWSLPRSYLEDNRRYEMRWGFSCGVLISEQRKLKNLHC
jgi:hypothetical protein